MRTSPRSVFFCFISGRNVTLVPPGNRFQYTFCVRSELTRKWTVSSDCHRLCSIAPLNASRPIAQHTPVASAIGNNNAQTIVDSGAEHYPALRALCCRDYRKLKVRPIPATCCYGANYAPWLWTYAAPRSRVVAPTDSSNSAVSRSSGRSRPSSNHASSGCKRAAASAPRP